MKKKYTVTLTAEERKSLQGLIAAGKAAATKLAHARILLKAEAALVRKPQAQPSRERKLDGKGEARLITLACSKPPRGRAAWTLRLLADTLVELQVVDAISHETVRQVLKKTS